MQVTMSFFVRFDPKLPRESIPGGFNQGINYPVFAIRDIDYDGEGAQEGQVLEETDFLLADNTSHFHWIDSSLVVRASPQDNKVPYKTHHGPRG